MSTPIDADSLLGLGLVHKTALPETCASNQAFALKTESQFCEHALTARLPSPAIHGRLPYAKGVSLRQRGAAQRAREAVHVEHQVSRSHHQLRRGNRRLASRTPLRAE